MRSKTSDPATEQQPPVKLLLSEDESGPSPPDPPIFVADSTQPLGFSEPYNYPQQGGPSSLPVPHVIEGLVGALDPDLYSQQPGGHFGDSI
jgi:hypothetical protein